MNIEMMARLPQYVRAVPQAVLDHYKQHACCATCHAKIGDAAMRIQGDRIFHQRCAHPQPSSNIRKLPTPPTAPSIIGTLEGSAGDLCDPAGCSVLDLDGWQHETYTPTAFDRSLRTRDPFLRLDHNADFNIEGRFETIGVDRLALRFRFQLFDSVIGQKVLRLVREKRITGCSIGRTRGRSHFERTTEVFTDVQLNEISLVTRCPPAWYGTWVRVE